MNHQQDIAIRAANERDVRDIAEIIHDSFKRFSTAHVPADMPGYHPDHIAEQMADPATRWALAVDQGRRIGVAMWRLLPGVSHLHLLFVRSGHQGRGIGGRLLTFHQREVRREQSDTRLFTLHCLCDSAWAIRFYKHHGYTLYEAGDEGRVIDLVTWIDACRSHDNGWPLRHDKALFYRLAH